MRRKSFALLFAILGIVPLINGCAQSSEQTNSTVLETTKTYEKFIQDMKKSGKKNYRLKSDIIMPNDTYISYSLGEFFGSFDGQGYTLKNFKVIVPYTHYTTIADMGGFGLFSVLKENSTIRNVKLDNFEIHIDSVAYERVVGGLVGKQEKNSVIENISGNLSATIDARSNCISYGGLVGESFGQVKDINIEVDIANYSEATTGGVVGYGDVSLSKVRVDGTYTAYGKNTGGVIGVAYTSTLNEVFTDLSMTIIPRLSANVGGIVGILGDPNHYPSTLKDAMAVGDIKIVDSIKTINAGGIVGQIHTDSYVRDVVSLVNIHHSEEYQFPLNTLVTLGAISGKSQYAINVRNGIFSNELGTYKAIGNLTNDPLYHHSLSTNVLRDSVTIKSLNDNWRLVENHYPSLSFLSDSFIGNRDKPIMIHSISDFNRIYVKPWAHYLLTKDLVFLYEYPQTRFDKTKPFCGVFDGGLHQFKSLRFFDVVSADASVFRYISSAEIRQLRFSDVDVFVSQSEPHHGSYGLLAHEANNSVVEKIEIVGECTLSIIAQTSGYFGYVVGSVFGSNSRFEYIIVDGSFILVDNKIDEYGELPETIVSGVFGYVQGEKQRFRKIIAFALADYFSTGSYPSYQVAIGFGRIDHADIYVTESRHESYYVDENRYYPSFRFANHVTPGRMVEIPMVMEQDWIDFDDDVIDVVEQSFRLAVTA